MSCFCIYSFLALKGAYEVQMLSLGVCVRLSDYALKLLSTPNHPPSIPQVPPKSTKERLKKRAKGEPLSEPKH